MSKNDINKYYIGELYLAYPINENAKQFLKRCNETKEIESNGAIPLYKDLIIDINKQEKYFGVLTIFYKTSSGKLICLHNGNSYEKNKNDYYRGILPLKNLLPKISYNCPNTLSFNSAINTFSNFFHKKYLKYNNNSTFPIEDFYIGNLNIFTSNEKESSDGLIKETKFNNPYTYLTMNSDAPLIGGFYKKKNDENYYYNTFSCLFLKNRRNSLYNVNNFQNYKNGIIKNEEYQSFKLRDSFYDYMIPMIKLLDERSITHTNGKISLPKALILQKRINKKPF